MLSRLDFSTGLVAAMYVSYPTTDYRGIQPEGRSDETSYLADDWNRAPRDDFGMRRMPASEIDRYIGLRMSEAAFRMFYASKIEGRSYDSSTESAMWKAQQGGIDTCGSAIALYAKQHGGHDVR